MSIQRGKTNRNGQVIVKGSTIRIIGSNQRTSLMECQHCGHQYVTENCQFYQRKCTRCQGGEPGLDE